MKTSDCSDSRNDHSTQTDLPSLSGKTLEAILRDHQAWLDSEGKKGGRAMLEGVCLAGAPLDGVNLNRARMAGADLTATVCIGASFHHADLTGCNFHGADLTRADMKNAHVGSADFTEALLKETDLSQAEGLLGGQLAMADLTGAALPLSIAINDGLTSVREASQNARQLFFGMLLACGYTALTVATTNDLKLMTNTASSPMPIIGTSIPIVYFYFSAPFLLMCLYCYLHLYQQRLWEGLAKLPAVFPDGRPLNEKAYPWLMNGLISRHFIRLRHHQPRLAGLQAGLSIFLSWWTVPLTLFFVWQRYLRRHDLVWTVFHILILMATMGAGIVFYQTAKLTLQGRGSGSVPEPKTIARSLSRAHLWALMLFATGLCTVSFGGIYNTPGFISRGLQGVKFKTNINLSEAQISTPPSNFDQNNPDHLMFVKGASLAGRNLRHAILSHAFLVKADLRGADLRFADLRGANLMGAQLGGADFQGADLRDARLSWQVTERGAAKYLWNAQMSGADLTGADLRQARMPGNLTNVILRNARMGGTDFDGVKFTNGDLRGADLSKSVLEYAVLNGARLTGANLSEADLSFADLGKADLRGVNFTRTRLNSTDFAGADLNGARGLTLDQLKGHPKAGRTWPARNILLAHCDETLIKLLGFSPDHENRLARLDFSGYPLSRADLGSANLNGSNFRKADLSHAYLEETEFRDADFRDAILNNARMGSANFRGADLRYASFLNISWSSGTRLDLANIYATRIDPVVKERFFEYGAVEIKEDDLWQGMKTTRQQAW